MSTEYGSDNNPNETNIKAINEPKHLAETGTNLYNMRIGTKNSDTSLFNLIIL